MEFAGFELCFFYENQNQRQREAKDSYPLMLVLNIIIRLMSFRSP